MLTPPRRPRYGRDEELFENLRPPSQVQAGMLVREMKKVSQRDRWVKRSAFDASDRGNLEPTNPAWADVRNKKQDPAERALV
jgi:hypothetical protein